jgi:hypothetical protein
MAKPFRKYLLENTFQKGMAKPFKYLWTNLLNTFGRKAGRMFAVKGLVIPF